MTDRIFIKANEIVHRKIADETLLVPIRGELADMQKIYVLDPVGEFIWNRLDGFKTVAEIGKEVSGHFDVDKDEAMADLHEFIDELFEANLVKACGL